MLLRIRLISTMMAANDNLKGKTMLKQFTKAGMALAITLPMLMSTQAVANELTVNIEIPKIPVAEYHRPYVGVWIEGEGIKQNLAVWYQLDRDGEDWLKDIRQWWRKLGRSETFPVDGVSGATKAPGTHSLILKEGTAPLGNLKPGKYTLYVEAAREVGGRELLQIPFEWPSTRSGEAQGKSELGKVSLIISQ